MFFFVVVSCPYSKVGQLPQLANPGQKKKKPSPLFPVRYGGLNQSLRHHLDDWTSSILRIIEIWAEGGYKSIVAHYI